MLWSLEGPLGGLWERSRKTVNITFALKHHVYQNWKVRRGNKWIETKLAKICSRKNANSYRFVLYFIGGARSFSCMPLHSCELRNSIPYYIPNSITIDTFKRKLKTWLFCNLLVFFEFNLISFYHLDLYHMFYILDLFFQLLSAVEFLRNSIKLLLFLWFWSNWDCLCLCMYWTIFAYHDQDREELWDVKPKPEEGG